MQGHLFGRVVFGEWVCCTTSDQFAGCLFSWGGGWDFGITIQWVNLGVTGNGHFLNFGCAWGGRIQGDLGLEGPLG